MFGGRLLAIDKKTGGIGPIAVGNVWSRLTAKFTTVHASESLADYFNPLQVGVGVHATRRFLSTMFTDNIIVKLDFRNAFNSLYRSYMLKRVSEVIPELYKFCHLA